MQKSFKFCFNSGMYFSVVTPLPFRGVEIFFSPMVTGWAGRWVGVWAVGRVGFSGEKFVEAVSQEP